MAEKLTVTYEGKQHVFLIPDAELLRAGARVYRRRSRKPNAFWTDVLVRLLMNAADRVEAWDAGLCEPPPPQHL